MHLVDVQSRDIFFLLEISQKKMKYLDFILANSELKFDSNVPEEKAAAEYLTEELFPFVHATLEGAKNGT